MCLWTWPPLINWSLARGRVGDDTVATTLDILVLGLSLFALVLSLMFVYLIPYLKEQDHAIPENEIDYGAIW